MLLGTHLILNRSEKAECFNIFPFVRPGPKLFELVEPVEPGRLVSGWPAAIGCDTDFLKRTETSERPPGT